MICTTCGKPLIYVGDHNFHHLSGVLGPRTPHWPTWDIQRKTARKPNR